MDADAISGGLQIILDSQLFTQTSFNNIDICVNKQVATNSCKVSSMKLDNGIADPLFSVSRKHWKLFLISQLCSKDLVHSCKALKLDPV